MIYFDFHCHPMQLAERTNLTDEFTSARQRGVQGWLAAALSQDEWDWYTSQQLPSVSFCAGLHPFYEPSRNATLDFVHNLAKNKLIAAIGEIGLDGRGKDSEHQLKTLAAQLEIARDYQLPVIFHCVRKHAELQKLINSSFPDIQGVIHSFTGTPELVNSYKKLGFAFSLGSPLVSQSNSQQTLRDILKWGAFFFETDSPYQIASFHRGAWQPLSILPDVVALFSKMACIEESDLVNRANSVLRDWFPTIRIISEMINE